MHSYAIHSGDPNSDHLKSRHFKDQISNGLILKGPTDVAITKVASILNPDPSLLTLEHFCQYFNQFLNNGGHLIDFKWLGFRIFDLVKIQTIWKLDLFQPFKIQTKFQISTVRSQPLVHNIYVPAQKCLTVKFVVQWGFE